MFRVTRYPMISKTESGRVGYRNKYRVAGRVRVPAGHWTSEHEAMVEDQLRRSSGLSTEGLGGDGGEEEGDIIWMIQT